MKKALFGIILTLYVVVGLTQGSTIRADAAEVQVHSPVAGFGKTLVTVTADVGGRATYSGGVTYTITNSGTGFLD